jgi:hypothetical protein
MHRIKKRTIVLLAGLAAMIAAPFAIAAGEGQPLDGGARNPSNNQSQAYTRETEVIANNATYGTRQSNKSDNGGGAIYGCRSKEGGTPRAMRPCLRATNLSSGLAFEYQTEGPLGGTFEVGRGGDGTKPFTTNATGVATGLNADRVDGKSADDFVAKDGKAADADKLDGRDSTDFASAGSLAFAKVTAAGNVDGGRGAQSASFDAASNTFTVVFNRDVSSCSYTATESGGTASDEVGISVAAASGNANAVTVDQDADGPVPFNLQVIC